MNRYPYASNLYNEAFKLYNAGVLEKISWTKLFHRLGASESTQVIVFGEQNKNFEDKLVLDYIVLSKEYMLYKSNYDDNNYLFNFSDGRLVISIF